MRLPNIFCVYYIAFLSIFKELSANGCLNQLIEEKYFGRKLMVLRSSSVGQFPLRSLSMKPSLKVNKEFQVLMESLNFTVQVLDDSALPIRASVQRNNERVHDILILLEEYTHKFFLHLIEVIRTRRVINSRTKFLVFVWEVLPLSNVKQVLDQLWASLSGFYSVVMTLRSTDVADVFSIYDIDKSNGKLREVGTCTPAIFIGFNFTKPSQSMYGVNLTAAVDAQEPYISNPFGSNARGVEVEIIKEFGRQLNMTVVFLRSPAGEDPRVAIVNDSFSGIFGMLHRQEAVIGAAGVTLYYPRVGASTILPPHSFDDFIWCAPRLTEMVNWRSFYAAFKYYVWLLMVLSILAITGIFMAKRPKSAMQTFVTFLEVLAMSLGHGCGSSMTTFRSFTGLVLLYFLIFTNLYRSGLTTLLTSPPLPDQIASVAEAVSSNYHFYFHTSTAYLVEQAREEVGWDDIFLSDRHHYELNTSVSMEQVGHSKTGIYLEMQSVCDFWERVNGHSEISILHYLPRYNLFPVAFYVAPGHPLEPYLHRTMLRMIQAGLPGYWMNLFLFQTKLKAITSETKALERNPTGSKITLHKLEVCFYFLTLALIFCFAVFVAEHFWFVLSKKQSKVGFRLKVKKTFEWFCSDVSNGPPKVL